MNKIKNVIFLLLVLLIAGSCSRRDGGQVVGQGSSVSEQPAVPTQSGEFKEFKITAKQFEFSPSVIEVNQGDKVRLIVTSTDIPHGIAIKEYGINEQLNPGKPVTIEFTANKEGTFTAYCSVFCGSGHSNMKGRLVVK